MIVLVYGENTYTAAQAVNERLASYAPSAIERYDGSELGPERLPDLLQGMSLFASERAVIIKNASTNKVLWEELAKWGDKVSKDVTLILVELTPDKRTKTFKLLQKQTEVVECSPLNEVQAATWLREMAQKAGGELSPSGAKLLVEYCGVDQWQLAYELEKLLLADDTSVERIKATIEPTPQANVFALLDAVFAGRGEEVRRILRHCESVEDPYRLFGLLTNQVYQLAVVSNADGKSSEAIAKAIGAHPYPIKKLQGVARRLSRAKVARTVEVVAQLDDHMKRTVAEPWLLIEQALMKIAMKEK